MKNLMLFLLFFLATICNAQIKLETNKEGRYRIAEEPSEWVSSGVTIDVEALDYFHGASYQRKISEAISKPGEKILVYESKKVLRLKLVFKKEIEIQKKFISYDGIKKNIKYQELKEIKEEASYFIVLCLLSLIFMIISNIVRKRNDSLCLKMWFLSFLFGIISMIVSDPLIGIIFILVSMIFSIYAIASNVHKAEIKYKWSVLIYYASMVICLILLFV